MTTHFITTELALESAPEKLKQAIEAELSAWGEPLRWAITQVNEAQQTVQIEAVVICE